MTSRIEIEDPRISRGEPWGPRLWLGVAVVAVVTTVLCSYGISRWPMADDEVPSLVEMGLFDVPADAFSVPGGQIGRLPRAMPVWYGVQRAALGLLPANEFGFRLPSLICAILTAMLAFAAAARWRGLVFASALAMMLNGSQMFVFLAQIDRFYSMPLLLLTATLVAMAMPGGGLGLTAAVVVLAGFTALAHNLTVAVFGLASVAACGAYLLGRAPATLVQRSVAAAAISAGLYLGFIRPIIAGWSSTGNPTPTLVSFAAHSGMPVLALAALGTWLVVVRRDTSLLAWWALLFLLSLCFMPLAPVSWNPRYFVFFMPAMWVLSAHAIEYVAARLEGMAAVAGWYCCVAAMLMPMLVSHLSDGSRHDYRQAAAILVQHVTPGQAILSDDAETISYYLPAELRQGLRVRTKVRVFPDGEFYLVARMNAWMALPQIEGRPMTLVSEVYSRRFDHFSHILRVYRIPPAVR